MENIKEIFASFGLWSLVEDISDDGDGIGDDLQLTKEGEEARRMIERELDKARKEGREEGIKQNPTITITPVGNETIGGYDTTTYLTSNK